MTTDWAFNVQSTEMVTKGETKSIKWLDKSLLTEITAKQSIKSPGKSLLTDYSQTHKRFKRTLFIIFI